VHDSLELVDQASNRLLKTPVAADSCDLPMEVGIELGDEPAAILDGHVNYNGVDGVLSRIGALDPGDTVYIDGLHNGKKTRVKFKITGVRTYHKTALPYKQIFDQKSVGRIAIVTCGGPFNAQTGNYLDNIVAFAVPA